MNKREDNLKKIANAARKLIIQMACKSKSAHVGSALSCVDLLVSLYFYGLNINLKRWSKRDIFILSKGHAAMALYAVLRLKKIISQRMLDGYFQNNGTLPAHLDRFSAKGIEVSAGSLGHGFNMGLGMAYGYKFNKEKRRVFVLIGDGETQEGSIWEGALFGAKLGLDNITVLLDRNDLQGYGRPSEICAFEPIIDKWRAFGWHVLRIGGHNFKEIIQALNRPSQGKPKIIIADTCKGKGISFMENQMKWHYFIVTEELMREALAELERQ